MRCGICGKRLERQGAMHPCGVSDPEAVIAGGQLPLLQRLERGLQRNGPLKRSLTHRTLTFSSRTGFCVIYPRKESLELGFILHRPHEELPVYRIEPFAGGKWVHWTRLYDSSDVDRPLLRLLGEAYRAAL